MDGVSLAGDTITSDFFF